MKQDLAKITTKNQDIGFALPKGDANRKSLESDDVLEIQAIVKSFDIRSVKQYKNHIRAAHSRGQLMHLPIEAAVAFNRKWNDILFNGDKFATYSQAKKACVQLKVYSERVFNSLPGSVKLKHNLPSRMSHYQGQFEGWVKFKGAPRPTYAALIDYCEVRHITTIAGYKAFANSAEGQALFIPLDPSKTYKTEWRGWDKILCPKQRPHTINSRQAKRVERAKANAARASK